MKIDTLVVTDPRRQGAYADPYVSIGVDESVDELGMPSPVWTKGNVTFRTMLCGPFVALESKGVSGRTWRDATVPELAAFNATHKHPEQLMRVEVVDPERTHALTMNVPRVRRLLRRFHLNEWQVINDDDAALKGNLSWRPEIVDPWCLWYNHGENCGEVVYRIVVHNGTHLPLCTYHNTRLQEARASNRTRTA